jgi:plastocyanin
MNPSGTNVIDVARKRRPLPQIGARLITFVPAVLAVAVLAGCSSGRPASATGRSDGVQAVTFRTTDEFRFVPATATVHTGKVRITLTDTGSYPHNISFPSLHATSASVSGSVGQTSTTLLLTFATPGRYTFVCTYHSSAGMKGQLVVLKRP